MVFSGCIVPYALCYVIITSTVELWFSAPVFKNLATSSFLVTFVCIKKKMTQLMQHAFRTCKVEVYMGLIWLLWQKK